jgi:hypothetical protein
LKYARSSIKDDQATTCSIEGLQSKEVKIGLRWS